MRLLLALLAPLALSAAPEPAATSPGQEARPAPPVPVALAIPLPEARVPFGCGLSFPVSQAHAVGSHLQHDTWAWDFRMPEGTPVVAAYDGVVRLARGDSTTGGCDPRYAPFSNYVVVNHRNGLETQYLHFKRVVVRPGDPVKAGDLLGYSGRTGWACGAHLHFKVARAAGPGWNNPSVRAQISGHGDPQLDAQVVAPACQVPEIQVAVKEPTPQDLAAPALGASPPAPAPAVAPAPAAAPAADTVPATAAPPPAPAAPPIKT